MSVSDIDNAFQALTKQGPYLMSSDEGKLESVIESLEDGYYEVDLAGNLVSFNQAMCDILGYDSSEMTGMNNRDFMDKDNAKKVFQTFNKVYRTKKGRKALDWQFTRKDGSVCHVDTSVSLLTGTEGDPVGFTALPGISPSRKIRNFACSNPGSWKRWVRWRPEYLTISTISFPAYSGMPSWPEPVWIIRRKPWSTSIRY